jgi:hypothetical protein
MNEAEAKVLKNKFSRILDDICKLLAPSKDIEYFKLIVKMPNNEDTPIVVFRYPTGRYNRYRVEEEKEMLSKIMKDYKRNGTIQRDGGTEDIFGAKSKFTDNGTEYDFCVIVNPVSESTIGNLIQACKTAVSMETSDSYRDLFNLSDDIQLTL